MGYFKLGDAFKELKEALDAKETAIAGAKLVGKTLFNAGKYVVENAPAALADTVERASSEKLQDKDLTDEEREKFEAAHKNAKRVKIEQQIKKIDRKIDELEQTENADNSEIDTLNYEKKRLERDLEREMGYF